MRTIVIPVLAVTMATSLQTLDNMTTYSMKLHLNWEEFAGDIVCL